MSNVIPQPQNPFQKKIIHAFLGRGHGGSVKINLVAPYHAEIEEIECSLIASPMQPQSQKVRFKDEVVRLYEFEFSGLIEGQVYSYKFSANGKALELGGGLKDVDLYFEYWSSLKESDSVIAMSCNGLFFYKNENHMWDMWRQLSENIETGLVVPKLLILGGDQYYQDEVEYDWFDKVDNLNFKNLKSEFKLASLENALRHWEDLAYRKVMARIPSVAMLDDHDITDGANGNRNDLYVGDTASFNEKWQNFSSIQKELFSLLQASRNPTPVLEKKNQAFSFVIDLGEAALVALDLRTEKNARSKVLMDSDSKIVLFDTIRKLPHKNVMILIPVVPIKNSQSVENTALAFAKIAGAISLSMTKKTKLEEKLKKHVNFVAGLEDDITDALCSDSNKEFFFELLNLIMDGSAKGVNYTLISGDIHAAGSVEVHLERNDQYVIVPILVSSPIAYEPMSFLVEALLKEKKMIELKDAGITLSAVNHAFTTNRNYLEIFPSKLLSNPNEAALIHEEGIEGSKAVMVKGWNRSKSRSIKDVHVVMAGLTVEAVKEN